MIEEWRTLKYGNEIFKQYEVSNLGRIRNASTQKIKAIYCGSRGYMRCSIYIGRHEGKAKQKCIRVHRAVAFTFLKPIPGKNVVNHIDGNKLNNCVDNLEWVTGRENYYHALDVLHIRELYRDTMCKTFSKEIRQLTKSYDLVATWTSTREVERALGYAHENVAACARGVRPSAYGYLWEYVQS